jgi:hypothetical protein
MSRISAPAVPGLAALSGGAVSDGATHPILMLAAPRQGGEGVHHAQTH